MSKYDTLMGTGVTQILQKEQRPNKRDIHSDRHSRYSSENGRMG